jgi:hypothetical protein
MQRWGTRPGVAGLLARLVVFALIAKLLACAVFCFFEARYRKV